MSNRPTTYVKFTDELAEEILTRIAEGESLRSICLDERMPGRKTVMERIVDDESFRSKYARAREIQTEVMVDEMQEIADNGSNDWMERNNAEGQAAGWVQNGEAVARSKLRLEQRRWYAEKLLPKKYGRKEHIEHSGTVSIGDTLREAREKRKAREG